MLDNYFNLLCNIGIVQINETSHFAFCCDGLKFRVTLNSFIYMAVGFPSNIVVQNIQYVSFFNSLFHGIQVKGFLFALCVKGTEKLKGVRFGSSGKSNHRNIFLFTAFLDFIKHFIFFGFFFLIFLVGQNIGNWLHINAFGGRVCLINQYCKFLVLKVAEQIIIEDVVELMDCSNNNLRISTKSDSQIFWIALVIHDFYLTTFMLDAKDSLLKLTVNDDTVGDNQNGIKYIVIICIMNGC